MRDVTPWTPGPGWLFCPADRPERYAKALGRADVVVLDLEDAVAENAKGGARAGLRTLAAQGGLDIDRTVVRLNPAGTAHHDLDVALARDIGVRRVMLAKTGAPAEVAALAGPGGFEVIALLETPAGVEYAREIAATPGVIAVMWGADDLVAAMGGTSSRRVDGTYRDYALHARSRALIAAKAHGRLALDAVHMDIGDLDGLRAAARDAAAVGFDATLAIHPSQVPVIREAYAPEPARLAWAQGLLAAFPDGPVGGVGTYEGQMVDGPVFTQALAVLRRSGSNPSESPR